MKLYEIDDRLQELYDRARSEAEESEGEIGADTCQLIDAYQMEFSAKVGNICKMYKNLTAESEAVKAEADRLAKRAKSLKGSADWLKNYLSNTLRGEKYKDDNSVVSYRRSEIVNILMPEKLTDEFVRVKVEPDKTAIKDAIKAGRAVEGAELVEHQNIQIK
jgi:hypothetical protein